MTFVKGQSGNPGGRPKVDHKVRDIARKAGPEAIRRLVELMRQTEDGKLAKSAADSLLDRGFGKAVQQIQQKHDFGPNAEDLTDEQLAATVLGQSDEDAIAEDDDEDA